MTPTGQSGMNCVGKWEVEANNEFRTSKDEKLSFVQLENNHKVVEP
jgi:hypothetical protein